MGRIAGSSLRTACQIPPTSGPATRTIHPPPSMQSPPGRVGGRNGVRRLLGEAQPQVGRVRGREQAVDLDAQVVVEGRHVGAEVRQAEQRAVVLQRMVGGPHHAVAVTAAVADQHHRQPVQADVVADLLERPGVDERRDAVDPRAQPGPRQPGGHRDHVLLGDAGVDEPLPQGIAQRLQGHEAEVAGQEHEPRAAGGLYERLTEGFSHAPSVSRVAWRYLGPVNGTCCESTRSLGMEMPYGLWLPATSRTAWRYWGSVNGR